MEKPNLTIFAETLCEIAQNDRDVVVVTSDSRGSAQLSNYAKLHPKQLIEVGIAEQNLVGISAGLAMAGKKVFAVSPACFLTTRALEQIKNDVAYSDHPVKLVGISAGVSYGALGSTHHSLHDFAVLQAIHNIDIVVPADNFETRQAVLAAWKHPKPIYLRFGKKPMPDLPQGTPSFEFGKARILSSGSDISLICSGEIAWRAVEAARILKAKGISCEVISMPFLKPFDQEAIMQAATKTKAIITIEEHSKLGGLGSSCAGLLLERGIYCRFRMKAIPDENTVNGSQDEIFTHYGITAQGIAQDAIELLQVEAVH